MNIQLENYDYIVGYGIGQYYESIKESFSENLKLDAICDKKFEDSGEKEYDGLPIIKKEELTNHKNILVVIMLQNHLVQTHIQRELSAKGISFVHVDEILNNKLTWTGAELKCKYPDGHYEDNKGNKIFFDGTLSDIIQITFRGNNNVLEISKNVVVGKLWICFGNNGFCIGNC